MHPAYNGAVGNRMHGQSKIRPVIAQLVSIIVNVTESLAGCANIIASKQLSLSLCVCLSIRVCVCVCVLTMVAYIITDTSNPV